ncbi:MAG: glycosyltransferase family 1 protein [bacterium]|nr:glycosyltransferase family 1 protein [bacterium]
MKRIGLDLRLCGSRHAGLGRYSANLALRLPFLVPADYQLVYFFADKTQLAELVAQLGTLPLAAGQSAAAVWQKIEIVYAPIDHYSLAEQTQLPRIFRQAHLDLLHVPHFNAPYFWGGSKLVLTIHDLLWHEKKGMGVTTLPAWQYWLKYRAYLFLVDHVVARAQAIITVSQTAKKTITRFYPRAASKIKVIYNGVKPQVKPNVVAQEDAPLLYVGSLYPHKNLEVVLRALAREPHLRLQIVSARDAFAEKIEARVREMKLTSRVEFLGKVSDQRLTELYSRAKALVQPSFSEGFGLTGVEALQLGTPVIASNIAVFHEVYGEAAVFFEPESIVDFLTAVKKSTKLRASATWQRLAAQTAGRYNWDEMAQATLAVYAKVLS